MSVNLDLKLSNLYPSCPISEFLALILVGIYRSVSSFRIASTWLYWRCTSDTFCSCSLRVFLSWASWSRRVCSEFIFVCQLLLNDMVYRFLKYSTKDWWLFLILFNSDMYFRNLSLTYDESPPISFRVWIVWWIKLGYPSRYWFTLSWF